MKSCHWKAMYHLTKVEHVFIPFATDVAQGTHVASCSETGARVWNPSQLINFFGTTIGFLWDVNGISMGFPMGFQKDVYGISIGFLWDFHDVSMICLEDFYGISEGMLWEFWYSYGIFIGFLWDFYGVSMMFLLYFFGIPMAFLWEFHDVSMILLSDYYGMSERIL